jgi:hypothetical protein
MYWKIIINQTEGGVELWNETECIASKDWQENRNTSQEILGALEAIKAEQGIQWSDVPELQLALDLPPHSTARRIAETFENTYNTFVASK